ncbi:MAG: hypothetical protein WKF75_13950 [Singulisphaera sp.]
MAALGLKRQRDVARRMTAALAVERANLRVQRARPSTPRRSPGPNGIGPTGTSTSRT